MTVSAQMQFIGKANGVNWYWADPALFTKSGVYYWNGTENVLVEPNLLQSLTEKKCPNLLMKGGCPLHNLQCGFPDCNK